MAKFVKRSESEWLEEIVSLFGGRVVECEMCGGHFVTKDIAKIKVANEGKILCGMCANKKKRKETDNGLSGR